MSVKIRPYRGKEGSYEYDIFLSLPSGEEIRERRKSPVSGKENTKRWAAARERELYDLGLRGEQKQPKKEIPTVEAFWPRFVQGVLVANKAQPGTLRVKSSHFRTWILPKFGSRLVSSIDSEDVALFTASLSTKKSGDKILLVLHQILEAAFKWGLSPKMPTFIWPPKQKPKKKLFPPELFEDLVGKAKAEGSDTFAFVLLAGEMAMRTGELQGLCWEQIDWRRGRLTVDRQIYDGLLKLPKGEKTRAFKPTPRTMVALKEMRHFRSDFVFADEEGRPWTKRRVEATCQRLYRSVGVHRRMGPHGLRHAAIQRMSLAGVPLDVIRQITGHADFRILQEYLHDDVEATGMVGAKLANFDFAGEAGGVGEILEKPSGAEVHILAKARRRRG